MLDTRLTSAKVMVSVSLTGSYALYEAKGVVTKLLSSKTPIIDVSKVEAQQAIVVLHYIEYIIRRTTL